MISKGLWKKDPISDEYKDENGNIKTNIPVKKENDPNAPAKKRGRPKKVPG